MREETSMAINKKTTALLVIDAIDPINDDTVYERTSMMGMYRANVGRVVDYAHKADLQVIYCNDQHIPGIDKELELWGDHGIKDAMRIIPEIKVGESDIIVPKRRYSGFFQTDLDLTLRELGITTLIAVGADTNICVLHTLADAFYLGYDTIVVEDATTTFLCGTQEEGIEHFVKCYGSQIVSVDGVATMLGV